MLILSEIRAQSEGPGNSQRYVRDFRKFLGKSRPTHRQSGRPSFWTLIAAKRASFLAHFSLPDIGLEMIPKIGYP